MASEEILSFENGEPDVIIEEEIIENEEGEVLKRKTEITQPEFTRTPQPDGKIQSGEGSGKKRSKNRKRNKKKQSGEGVEYGHYQYTDLKTQKSYPEGATSDAAELDSSSHGPENGPDGPKIQEGENGKPSEQIQTPKNQGQRSSGQRSATRPRSGKGKRSGQGTGSPHCFPGQDEKFGQQPGSSYNDSRQYGRNERSGSPYNHRYDRGERSSQQTGSPYNGRGERSGQRTGSPYNGRGERSNQQTGSPYNQRSQHGRGERYNSQTSSPQTQRYQQNNQRQYNTPDTGGVSNSAKKKKNRQQHRSNTPRKLSKPFESYLSKEDVSAGLKRGELIQGAIRINPKNYEDAYINNPENQADIYICGIHGRNRALNGDVVAVKILPKSEWKVRHQDYELFKQGKLTEDMNKLTLKSKPEPGELDVERSHPDSSEHENQHPTDSDETRVANNSSDAECQEQRGDCAAGAVPAVARKLFENGAVAKQQGERSENESIPERFYQKTGQVVYILEKKHSRAATGHLKQLQEKDTKEALFSPIDHRMPRMRVPLTDCPQGFTVRPSDFSSVLFVARLIDWPQDSGLATGSMHRSLGEAGEIEPETEGFLIENGVDYAEFSKQAIECLPRVSNDSPWKIPAEEITKRRDLRQQCIFTIDPATARDLDDALSCIPLGGGNYEVGVHIADVSYFLKEGTELDEVASERATSVYLVQKVIPMLPRLLCEQLCSLNPAEDRLTFSVIWTITEEGKILEEWMGRSVIRSCVKMTYQHAQGIIEDPTREWTADELPPVTANHNIPQIIECVLNLNKIAVNMRRQRFDDGALRLDQPKLAFTIDSACGLPNGCSVYQQKDSNRLVEEFMLLANMAVAHKIYRASPDKAMLRRHPPPKAKMFEDVVDLCKRMGMPINASTAGDLQTSLSQYYAADEHSRARCQILVHLCAKPMQMAKYFCSGYIDDEYNYRHYALNVPFYTHFTSPIRRYADVVVHRLLAESLKCGPPVIADKSRIELQAQHCNDKKTAAKRVQELSGDLFFAVFIKECGPVEEEAMVLAVLDQSFDVLVLKFGVIKRVYCNALPLKEHNFYKNHNNPSLSIVWKADDRHPEIQQTLKIFTLVDVILKADEQPLKYSAIIKRPDEN